MNALEQRPPSMPQAPLCHALNVPRASLYRHRHAARWAAIAPAQPRPAPRPHFRALTAQERDQVLATLNSPPFADKAPGQVHAALRDQGVYLCSTRTMYRVLTDNQQVRERRDQLRHPLYAKPQLLATAPNQVWSWDITKLLGPAKWTYYYLYVMMDIFSRYVTGWMLASCENAELARRFIRETIEKYSIPEGQLTLHSDRGAPMKSQTVAQLLAVLGVTKSHSRPHTSNDNPFSESQFKTMKYRPEFPDRFGSIEHGHGFCATFFPWYNDEHYHSGLNMLTPAMVHFGQAPAVIAARHATVMNAYALHPERFVRRPPQPIALPAAVWINPPKTPAAVAPEPPGDSMRAVQ